MVGGIKLPSIESTFTAFKAGAQSVNPKFEVKEIYTGNFDDLGQARIATLSLINAGADYIFHQANEAGRGVFQACSERQIHCFGSNKNQNDLAPEVNVASFAPFTMLTSGRVDGSSGMCGPRAAAPPKWMSETLITSAIGEPRRIVSNGPCSVSPR